MKFAGFLLCLATVVGAIFFIIGGIRANYEWSSQYGSYWDLGVKASTIAQKSQYIDQFVAKLDASGLQGSNDALFFPTPNNSFDSNMEALKSLQSRLHDIQTMDESSFQYQTAIQQITAQEQDDAGDMLDVLSNCWWKVHHPIYWNGFYFLGIIIGLIVLFLIGGALAMSDNY